MLGRLGRLLISAGVVTLAFTAYQLWGTGVLQAQAQDGLEREFAEFAARVASPVADERTASSPAERTATPGGTQEVELAETDPPPRLTPTQTLASERGKRVSPLAVERERGDVIGKLSIPRIELEQFVLEGVEADELKKGPGHYIGTPMPGMAGNASLAGHRTTWGAPFHRIDELQPGDEITVTMPWGDAVYEVIGHPAGDGTERGYFIVAPSDTWVLDQDEEDRLTLTSCHPKYSARERIIVTAKLVTDPVRFDVPASEVEVAVRLPSEQVREEAVGQASFDEVDASRESQGQEVQAPSSETATADVTPALSGSTFESTVGSSRVPEATSFGEGLSGDRSAIPPAVAWSLTAMVLWWTTGFVSRRWRRWPSYLIGAAPVAAVWLVAFTHIDRAIPSY